MSNQFTFGKRIMRLALGATIAGAAFAAQTAHAAIVVVNFSGNPLSTVPFNIDGVYINVVTGVAATTELAAPGWDINPYYIGTGGGGTPLLNFFSPSGGGGVLGPLVPGASVSSASTFSNALQPATQPTAGTRNFGFRFLNEATAATNYGYVTVQQLTAEPLSSGSVRILGYAYENTGLAIATPVPEPTTALMMLGGLLVAGVAARKRLAA